MNGKSKEPFKDFINQLESINGLTPPQKIVKPPSIPEDTGDTETDYVLGLIRQYGLPYDGNSVSVMVNAIKGISEIGYPLQPPLMALIGIILWEIVQKNKMTDAMKVAFWLGVSFGMFTEFDERED